MRGWRIKLTKYNSDRPYYSLARYSAPTVCGSEAGVRPVAALLTYFTVFDWIICRAAAPLVSLLIRSPQHSCI